MLRLEVGGRDVGERFVLLKRRLGSLWNRRLEARYRLLGAQIHYLMVVVCSKNTN